MNTMNTTTISAPPKNGDDKLHDIADFEEFSRRCHALHTVQEKVGLLFGGTDVEPFANENLTSEEVKSDMIERWVKFYIRESSHKNKNIAKTAQRIIARHWLARMPSWKAMYTGYLAAIQQVLKFLEEPMWGLYDPPHPRLVSEWLLALHEEWECGSHPIHQGGDAARKALQGSEGFDKLLVNALCSWGLAYVLAKNDSRRDVIPHIEAFLRERGYNPAEALLGISGTGEPLSRLNSRAINDDISQVAARALLKLEFQETGRLVLNINKDGDNYAVEAGSRIEDAVK